MYKGAVYVFCALHITHAPISVATRSNALVCGRSVAATASSNPAWITYFSLLWVLCVVRKRSLRRTDHLSGGVLPSVMSLIQCDRESSTIRRLWPTEGCCAMVKMKILSMCRSRWPRGLTCVSAADRLLGWWVRIPRMGTHVCLLWVLCVV